jgi:hypothetical protein
MLIWLKNQCLRSKLLSIHYTITIFKKLSKTTDSGNFKKWGNVWYFASKYKRSEIRAMLSFGLVMLWTYKVLFGNKQLAILAIYVLARMFSFTFLYKFWEGHKILRNLYRRFVLCSNGQIYGRDKALER